jgi:hypothetical protein
MSEQDKAKLAAKGEPQVEASTKPRPEITADMVGDAAKLFMPNLEKYYPDKERVTYNDFSPAQMESLEWLQWHASKQMPHEILNELKMPLNAEGEKFAKGNVFQKYVVLNALLEGTNSEIRDAAMSRAIERMRTNGILSRDQETEFITTDYYATLFRSIQYNTSGLNATRGMITAKAQTCRLLYQRELSSSDDPEGLYVGYTALLDRMRAIPSANISTTAGKYHYRDVALTPVAMRTEIDDWMQREVTHPLKTVEAERLGYMMHWVANYNIDACLYDCGTADTVNSSGPITLAEFKTWCLQVAEKGYNPNVAIIGTTQYWTGLLGDTSNILNASAYGSTEPIQGARIPTLMNVRIYVEPEAAGFSYWRATADSQSGVLVDNNYSAVFIQRFPPIVENFRIPDRQVESTSVTWQFGTGALYLNAVSPLKY